MKPYFRQIGVEKQLEILCMSMYYTAKERYMATGFVHQDGACQGPARGAAGMFVGRSLRVFPLVTL